MYIKAGYHCGCHSKSQQSGCRFGQWRHGHRLIRDQWPVDVNRPLATTFIRCWSAQL